MLQEEHMPLNQQKSSCPVLTKVQFLQQAGSFPAENVVQPRGPTLLWEVIFILE